MADDPNNLTQLQKLEQQRKILEDNTKFLIDRDIALQRTNQELQKEKEEVTTERNKLSLILSGISDAVLALDLKRNIIIFNTAATKLLNLSSSQVLGQSINQIIRVYEKEKELTVDIYSPEVKDVFEGVLFARKELKVISPSGKESYVNMIVGQIKEGLDHNIGCILTLHDITEEKQLEHMKLDFVAMSAHELRTPITSLIGYLDLLNDQLKDSLDESQKGFLSKSLISSQQLNSLVNNILAVSNIENRSTTLALQPVDWQQNLIQVVNNFQSLAQQKGLTLKLNQPLNKLPTVNVDLLQINQVLNNLLNNAIIFTSNGGQIVVLTIVEGNQLITEVKDTGIGIPKEALPHIFTKFFRVQGALDVSSNSTGTGLSLYISSAIIKSHGGELWVTSELGKGSTFSFSLPVAST